MNLLHPKSRLLHFPFRLFYRSASNSSKCHWTSNRVRRTFIDYFGSQGCTFVPSSSVIPFDDRSLLFVNAGMNQFKPIFLGTVGPKDKRSTLRLAANSQKCVRAGGKHNDLADVGRDGTHHTFFEMLGNWAFNGSLPKKAACRQALTLLTDIYGLHKDRLVVTYFKGDEKLGLEPDLECREVWREFGFPDNRIHGLGMEDNFWEMSASGGPCGPCTEILYTSNVDSPSLDNCVEIWNIVFISYNKFANGGLSPLPAMHIDTGMGLERLCRLLQGVETNYDTDLFQPLMEKIQKQIGSPEYGGLFGADDTNGMDTAYRIVADHARMFTVSLSDGVVPAGRKIGHILRRIIRSAAYQGTLMSANVVRKERGKLNMVDLCNVVVDSLGEAYPELITNLDYIRDTITQEQALFGELFRKGKRELGMLLALKHDQVTVDDLFELQLNSIIPIEEIRAMMKKKNVQFDEEELNKKMEDHGNETPVHLVTGSFETDMVNVVNELKQKQVLPTDDSWKYRTKRLGSGRYSVPSCESHILAIAHDDRLFDEVPDDSCSIILDRTPFYSESGGQAGDCGQIRCGSAIFDVQDTLLRGPYVFHRGRLVSGSMSCGDVVEAAVDDKWRSGCMQHHTATHLVMATLSRQFNTIRQRSSKLNNQISEFGFWTSAHQTPISITQLENDVNSIILNDAPVFIEETEFEKAKAVASVRWLSGEPYPDVVRVVSIGSPFSQLVKSGILPPSSLISAELCCGTHVSSIADIGRVRIMSIGKGSTSAIKMIDFAAGQSALEAEKRGEDIRETLLVQLSKPKNVGSMDGLKEMGEEISEAIIPLVVRRELFEMLNAVSGKNEKRGLKKAMISEA